MLTNDQVLLATVHYYECGSDDYDAVIAIDANSIQMLRDAMLRIQQDVTRLDKELAADIKYVGLTIGEATLFDADIDDVLDELPNDYPHLDPEDLTDNPIIVTADVAGALPSATDKKLYVEVSLRGGIYSIYLFNDDLNRCELSSEAIQKLKGLCGI